MNAGVPHVLTGLRLAAAPAVYFLFLHCSCVLALVVFGLACLTDAFDGYLARRLGVASALGAYFDVWADFLLVTASFLAFVQARWFEPTLLGLMAVSFAVFLLSSRSRQVVYDPVGKPLGAILMVSVALTLLVPDPVFRKVLAYGLTALLALQLTARTWSRAR